MNARLGLAFLSGLVFSLGLALSGMTHPSKIIAFLDVLGRWDPSLMLVMAGAIGVYMPAYWLLARRWPSPVLAPSFRVPTRREIDRPLVAGALLFGVGWGLSGYCPGPAVVSVVTGSGPTLLFVASMLAGMALHGALASPRPLPGAAPPAAAPPA